MLSDLGSWQAPFIIAAVLLVFGAGIWAFWLNPEVSAIESGTVGRVAAFPAVEPIDN